MATKQKFFTGEFNSQNQKLYLYEGEKITSIEYTKRLEQAIEKSLQLKPAGRLLDSQGVDFVDAEGATIQLKIMHNGKSSYTLPFGELFFDDKHQKNYYTFRDALKKYARQFDKLVIYFGDSNIGSPFNADNIVIIEGKDLIYKALFLRTYRGYAQQNNAQCQFNKTFKSDLTERFLTKAEAEKWREEVLNGSTFNGSSKRVEYIKRRFFDFDKSQQFKSE